MKFFEKLFKKKVELEEKLSFIVNRTTIQGAKEDIVLAQIVLEKSATKGRYVFWLKMHTEYNRFDISIARDLAEWVIKMTSDSVLEEIREMKGSNENL